MWTALQTVDLWCSFRRQSHVLNDNRCWVCLYAVLSQGQKGRRTQACERSIGLIACITGARRSIIWLRRCPSGRTVYSARCPVICKQSVWQQACPMYVCLGDVSCLSTQRVVVHSNDACRHWCVGHSPGHFSLTQTINLTLTLTLTEQGRGKCVRGNCPRETLRLPAIGSSSWVHAVLRHVFSLPDPVPWWPRRLSLLPSVGR